MRLVLLLLVYFVYGIKPNKNALRIIGGRNASQDEFPYVVKIVLQKLNNAQANVFFCSSIVVTSTWTLTAAHCAENVREFQQSIDEIQAKVMIAYQSSRKSGSESYSEVLSGVPHPNYNQLANDIGLLHTQPLIFAKYGKLSSVDYQTLIGQEVTLVGYGFIAKSNDEYLELPQVLEAVVKNCDPLIEFYPSICFAPHCSSGKYVPKGLCSGDSGGPSIHASGVIGVNSRGYTITCGLYNNAYKRGDRYNMGFDIGIGTPISPFMDWITSVIKTDLV